MSVVAMGNACVHAVWVGGNGVCYGLYSRKTRGKMRFQFITQTSIIQNENIFSFFLVELNVLKINWWSKWLN